jgi:bifunctional DNase/RNase
MKTARFLPSQIWTIAQAEERNTVFIRPEGMGIVLPVYVSESDIQIILVELTHILAPRPNVHELLLSTISALDAKLERVEIYGIRSGTYLCRIVLLQNGKEIKLESRPSDILCLSARIECPVHIDDEILARNGIPVERVTGKVDVSDGVKEPPSVAVFLQKELQNALDHEEYERAVVLRDRLTELSSKGTSNERNCRISE